MILGMSTAAFTVLHVIISLIGILSGIVVVLGMLSGRGYALWTQVFLITTVATSATGFLFHSTSFGPPHIVGVISLIVLAVAIFALYARHLAGSWRWIYIVCAVLALYLNAFVGVVQAFQKIPSLHALAPTGSEAPFLAVQLLVMALFIAFGVMAVRRYHPSGAAPAFS